MHSNPHTHTQAWLTAAKKVAAEREREGEGGGEAESKAKQIVVSMADFAQSLEKLAAPTEA